MFTALYNRIERRAGGAHASPRQFIRAFRTMITAEAKTRTHRDARQKTVRDMLVTREHSIDQYRRVMSGQIGGES
jgi:hypothetical protein